MHVVSEGRSVRVMPALATVLVAVSVLAPVARAQSPEPSASPFAPIVSGIPTAEVGVPAGRLYELLRLPDAPAPFPVR